MDNTILNDKPAIKINAEFVTETQYAIYLDCEGDKIWFPKKHVKFNPADDTVLIEEWLYNDKFK